MDPQIDGAYRLEGKLDTAAMVVTRLNPGGHPAMFWLSSSQGWDGVGVIEGSVYRGVYCFSTSSGASAMPRIGAQAFKEAVAERLVFERASLDTSIAARPGSWVRTGPVPNPRRLPLDPSDPAPGDMACVEMLPEPIHRVFARYPEQAREKGVSGIVITAALVLADGSIADVRVLKSIPELDEAAIASVMQYRFRSAVAGGRPVAAWVPIPVRFTIH